MTYTDTNRVGDHICYYSDLRKLRAHYPTWNVTYSLDSILNQLIETVDESVGS